MAILKVTNLCKSFDDMMVLKNINVEMNKGEVLAIIGASGGGKTTFLRCVNSLTTPDSGRIEIDGTTVFDSSPGVSRDRSALRDARLKIGLVFQQFNLFPQYTVLDNVMLAPKLLKKRSKHSKAEIRSISTSILDQMGLSTKINNYPSELSGGQQQRVAIARALALEPQILCFDEPTSALDPALTGEVVKVVKELKDRNTTMLIVTHDMDFAHAVADRVIYMADGIVEEDAPVEVFFTNPKSDKAKAFIGLKG